MPSVIWTRLAARRVSISPHPFRVTGDSRRRAGSTVNLVTEVREPMKHYLLTIQQPDVEVDPDPEFLEPVMRRVEAFNQELKAAGAWVFAGGLELLHHPSTATVLRPRGDDVLMTDGPYVEGKEHVGGLTIIAAPDLDAALEWGRKLALAIGLPIEVRPFQGEPADHLP